MTFYYSNPTSLEAYDQANIAQDDTWVPISQLQQVVKGLKLVNFAARDSRNTGIEMLNSLVNTHPYRITGSATPAVADIRFGFTLNALNPIVSDVIAQMFVNCDRKGWDNCLAQARSALQYNDRNNEKTMLTDGGAVEESESVNAPNPQVVRSQFNDASQAFRRSLQQMRDLMRQRISVYNILTFENEFNLTWSLVAQQPIDE